MSLTERLEAARAERGSEGPTLTEIDLRTPPAPEGGLPLPCAGCGGRGFLDRIDLGAHVQHEHCRDCGARWSRPI
jgi:hypothetical protein